MDKIILTDDQKLKILERLNNLDLPPAKIKELLELIYPGQNLKATGKEGFAVRELIAEKGLEYESARQWRPKKSIDLTEEQKVFIGNNCNTMMPLEMARILFKNPDLTNLDSETRVIQRYIKDLPKELKVLPAIEKEEINIEDYRPPKTLEQTIARINKYVISAEYDKDKLSEKQKKEIKKLMQYLHIHRFLVTINEYETVKERDLFESSFVRGTYNKADLTQEQLDQYIMYSTAVVDEKTLEATIKKLRMTEDAALQERQTLPQAVADRLNDLTGKKESCIKRQNDILKSLEGERKERLRNNNQIKETVGDILAYFANESKRQHLLQLGRERREKLKEEINRIKNMADIRGEMFGVSEEELLE